MLTVREVDAVLHSGANDRFAEFFIIAVMKLVARKLTFDLVGDRYKKRWNVAPKKIDELIVGDNDQNIRLGCFEIHAQRRERRFCVLAQFLLLLERRTARRALRRHAVVEIHKIFPLAARFEKDVRSVARCQSGN